MTDHSFDKFIKEKLNNYSLPVKEGLWEKIQQENNKKVEGFFWWKNYAFISLIGIAALLTAIIILFHQNKVTRLPETKEMHVAQNRSLQNPPSQTQQSSATARANKNVSKSAENDNKALTKQNNLEDDLSGHSLATYSIRSNNQSAAISTGKKYDKRSISSLQIDYALDKQNNNKSNISSSSESSSSGVYKPVLLATAMQDKNLSDYATTDRLSKGLKDVNLFCLDGCPSAHEQVKNDLHLEIYASPDYARKTINNSGGVDEAFLKRKDSTESSRLSFSAGFRLTKTFGDNFFIKAGLQFSQINEKFSYRSENERNQTTVITIRKVLLTTGDTLMVRDTSIVVQIGYRVKTTYNRYRSIDVPLIAGYQWGNDNFKAAVSAGAILNLYSWQKGESLDTGYVAVAFNKDDGGTFKRNIGVGLYTGLSVLKKAGESTYLFAEPYLRYNVSSITNNRSLFNQKFDVYGVNFGIRYKLSSAGQRYFAR